MTQFVDEARMRVIAGSGGHGLIAFRREKFVPRGGPCGGDGGRGGSVIAVVDRNLTTLLDFRYRSEVRAKRGAHGGGSGKTGRSGESTILRVPPGTVITDETTGEVLGDLLEDGDQIILAKGGRGGRGNARFVTPTHQAPQEAEDGRLGQERRVKLTLKSLAEVGLVGFPNAGKSTLLSVLSAARPKVADYPFTTLQPHLGIVKVGDYTTFVMADIPGIIEGASEGKGLGHRFLRHIERTRVLLFLIDGMDPEPDVTLATLRSELKSYGEALLEKPWMVALSKADLIAEGETPPGSSRLSTKPFIISAQARRGLTELTGALYRRLEEARNSA